MSMWKRRNRWDGPQEAHAALSQRSEAPLDCTLLADMSHCVFVRTRRIFQQQKLNLNVCKILISLLEGVEIPEWNIESDNTV